jgi:RimJ/RimL family protein N-acetyltransferase
MTIDYQRVEIPRDNDQLVEFLCNNDWPFHRQSSLTPDDLVAMDFSSPEVASFWIVDDRQRVGLVRLLDLGDVADGAPLFDLRIANSHRGRGFGTRTTRWTVDHLFTTYPELHRIEANTRHDNAAMQRALSAAGFTHEGRLRDAWPSNDGRWFDTMVYGMLRTDWTPTIGGRE